MRDLRNTVSEVLRRVEGGERLTVTVDRRPVAEIVSPDDETYAKFGFYAAHGVDELLVVEPDERGVHLFLLAAGSYQPAGASTLLGTDAARLEQAIAWPLMPQRSDAPSTSSSPRSMTAGNVSPRNSPAAGDIP